MDDNSYDFVVIGGGLAGLCATIHLSKIGYTVLLLEKHEYPRHKVCGEYVSNEVLPYLKYLGFDPFDFGAKQIERFEISTADGRIVKAELPLGGFGISRYRFDLELFNIADSMARIEIDEAVDIVRAEEGFEIITKKGKSYQSKHTIGAYGKRSRLDRVLKRKFIVRRTPWMAVKTHYEADFEDDLVVLHNFEGGYCGLSKTETGTVNMCYLLTVNSFSPFGSIEEFESKVLCNNPRLSDFLANGKPIFSEPLTISQISFQSKPIVENGIFMLGDSASLIHPLCGNGMAMAIQSAKIFCDLLSDKAMFHSAHLLERNYQRRWKKTFNTRMQTGSIVQKVLLNSTAANLAFRMTQSFPSIVPRIIKRTHGNVMV